MIDESKISALSLVYDSIVPINERFVIVTFKRKHGIFDLLADDLVIKMNYTRFDVDRIDKFCFVTLLDVINSKLCIINTLNGSILKHDGLYKIGSIIDGILVIHEIRTSSGFSKTMLVRIDTMEIIVEPDKLNNIIPCSNSKYKMSFTLINSGYKLEDLVYFVDNSYRIVANTIKNK